MLLSYHITGTRLGIMLLGGDGVDLGDERALRVRLEVQRVRGVRVRVWVRGRGVRRARRVAARAHVVAVLAVHALLLEVAQALRVALDLVAQRRVLAGRALLVQLQAARAVQLL